MTYTIPLSSTKNAQSFREKINEGFAQTSAGYGDLPDSTAKVDGALWVEGGVLYQLQDGAWVALW